MELRSSIAFIGDSTTLERIDHLINEESLIDDMVFSLDFIAELETSDTYVFRCECTNDSWINIYEIQQRFHNSNDDIKCDIIYASTDSKTFIDVISTSGNFDAYVDTDIEKIREVCETYGLEYFGASDEDNYYEDEDENNDEYY